MSENQDDDFADAFCTIKPAEPETVASPPAGMQIEDFWAYAPTRQYLYEPCNTLFAASFVNSYFPPQPVLDANGQPKRHAGKLVTIPTTRMLDRSRYVNQLTWAPGESKLIEGRLLDRGGWKMHPGGRCLNQYQPPRIQLGDPQQATRWIDHLNRIYPGDAKRIEQWIAHRVQRPSEKINHALVLVGKTGIGKDTLLEPLKYAVGHWNFGEVAPKDLIGRNTDFLKSIVLRVSEARDLGEGGRIDRFDYYEHCKTLLATPPDVLRINEKYVREYYVINVLGMVITTNNRDALYLPHTDRRHDVICSMGQTEEFDADFWNAFYYWYHREDGFAHVAAYLRQVDLAGFDPKASPPKGDAFLDMADRGRAQGESELADAIDALENPPALTIAMLASAPGGGSFEWLLEKNSRRAIPHWLERSGYVSCRNPIAKDGLWRIKERRQVIYAREKLTETKRLSAAQELFERNKDIKP